MRVGPWVISDRDGELIATKPGEEIVFGQLPEEDDTVSDVTRGYIEGQIKDSQDLITESIGNPNGGGGIPKIKDYLSGKWDDLVEVREVADTRLVAGNNLVSNPGFEKTLFVHGDGALTTEIRRTGTKSAMVSGGGGTKKIHLICDSTGPVKITATAGDIFYVESWVWGKSTNNQVSGGANGMSIFIEVFNKDGVQIGQPITFVGPTASNALNNQWTRFYGYIAIPTGSPYNQTAMMSAYIGLNSNVASGNVYYFDDPIVRVDSLVNSWNYIFDGANGTTGSQGKLPFDLFDPLKNLREKALAGASGASGALITAQQAVQGASGALGLAQGVLDNIVIGLTNLTGQVYTSGNVLTAAQQVTAALSTLSTVTSNLVAQRDAGMFYGTAVNEAFLTYPAGSTLGGKWSQSSSGGGSAVFQVAPSFVAGYGDNVAVMQPMSGASNRLTKARLVAQTATRFQKVGIVFFSVGGNTSPAPTSGSPHRTRIYGRMSADHARYVYAEFTGTQVYIGFNNGGGDVTIGNSVKNYTYKAGVPYWLECGISAAAQYTYRLWEGTTVVTTGVDSSASSPNSPTDSLGAGFGGFVADSRYTPARVAGFTLLDNVPPVQRGIGFKASQLSDDANFNVSGSADAPVTGFFPSNWFVTEYATSNLLYTPSTNTLTVSEPGWYLVTINQKGSYKPQTIFNNRMAAGVWVNTGSGLFNPVEIGPSTQWSNIKESFGGVFVVYLQGGDQIRPGWKSMLNTSGTSYVGSVDGETCWTVTFLHNSYTKITSI